MLIRIERVTCLVCYFRTYTGSRLQIIFCTQVSFCEANFCLKLKEILDIDINAKKSSKETSTIYDEQLPLNLCTWL